MQSNHNNIAVYVENLEKWFRLKQKSSGFIASLTSIWDPNYKSIQAVHKLSFQINRGELVGFIGPNGAGKSTTIKMLTGILYPSSGYASVLNLTPWQNRRELSYNIGSVFGQKPQLWYHLPPIDTYNLMSHVYELDQQLYKKRRDLLIDIFQLEHLIRTPVRKLSLGQRMKCEIVSSLLHQPKIVFLDEPTIGLDVIAKAQIRKAITFINETEKSTILFTSHDIGDIENLCKRIIIINKGLVVYDGATCDLKQKFLTSKIITIYFSEPINFFADLPGMNILEQTPSMLKLSIDQREISVKEVMEYIISLGEYSDINIAETPLEDVIREIFSTAS